MNFYKKMEKKLNENNVYFGDGGQERVYLLNGESKLGKVYKPKMIKLINFIIKIAEKVRDEEGEVLYLWLLYNNTFYDAAKLEISLIDEEGVEVFYYSFVDENIKLLKHNVVKGDVDVPQWDLLKAFLNKVAKWDRNKI